MNTARFWMICRAPSHRRSRTEPKARFPTRAAAIEKAQSMAAETGAPFVVLEATDTIHPKDAGYERGLF